MAADFINSLIEARFFRYQENFDGRKISELANTLFLLMLLLEVVRQFNPEYAQYYSKQTYTYGDFSGIRSYATDIHNLIAILQNEKLQSKIIKDKAIFVPEFAIKRYFRDVMWGTREYYLNRSFFMQLSQDLKINDSNTQTARRTIIDYTKSSKQEIVDAADRINRRLNDLAINCDLHWWYKNNLKSRIREL